ncbi:HNH endonuclease [Xanthomonas sacchari]|uniref:HNH endonuclease n=1 Tax=Xanthomonas sacchari TaxID=56458 RepID=UPI002253F69C|nr:HNH endonuclease [Xanthomonas sacchari]MCW0411473.1 hypothetical protein [Xanthomonas sacchari]UYK66314.1 HNH endonuclease [Xanthomonas sacchari]UYK84511.1 HNH endonuclease [Xanthomonas sacchari]
MSYAFDLRQVCGGYSYFSAFSQCDDFGHSRYERRSPSEVDSDRFLSALAQLGQRASFVDSDRSLRDWLYIQGWALVDEAFAHRKMGNWLRSRKCIRSPLGSYTDIEIASPKALSRTYRGKAKSQILERDKNVCLQCGSSQRLTLQHVWAFSSGGETSSRNMVTLCSDCNQGYANLIDVELYRIAGLMHGVEPSLLKSAPDPHEAYTRAIQLSGNLMHTRCEVW